MKICPKCARSFADGFIYCPKDAAPLKKYDLRRDLVSRDEVQFLIINDSLLKRLMQEISSAADEFKRNPHKFLRGLLYGEGSSRRRRNLLRAGVATGVIAYSSFVFVTMMIGVFTAPLSTKTVIALKDPPPTTDELVYVLPVTREQFLPEKKASNSNAGHLGGSLREQKRAKGGGGQTGPTEARRGSMAMADPAKQLNLPDLKPPTINPSLIVPETIIVDPKLWRKSNDPIGLIDGIPNAPSLGNRSGTGIGSGDGPGYGNGKDGNTGGDKDEIGGGTPTGSGTNGDPFRITSKLKPKILYKEKALYTEEARQLRIQGIVLLNVTFGADGRIHDIRVTKGLPGGLTEKAIEAAQRIRFQPAMLDSRSVSVRGSIEYNFALY